MKKLLPPIFLDIYHRVNIQKFLYYFGDFPDWDEALNRSHALGGDYSDDGILDKVAQATQEVRRGGALYEQDSVLFHERDMRYPLFASLMYLQALRGHLDVLDFGGSLGSLYFRYKDIFEGLKVRWHIVEQEHFVAYGQKHVPEIDFQYKAADCFLTSHPNVLLLSSTLQYLEAPYKTLEELFSMGFEHILIDRTVFLLPEGDRETITCQHVPPSIYPAYYPLHLFGLDTFRKFFQAHGYASLWEWEEGGIVIKRKFSLLPTSERGFLFQKSPSGTPAS